MKSRLGYAIEQRLRLVDFLLLQYGTVNRSALERYFGISTPQASKDLSDYIKMAPNNMVYDVKAKTYRRGAGFKAVYP